MKNLTMPLILIVSIILISCDPESELLLKKITLEDDASIIELTTDEYEEPFAEIVYCGDFMPRSLVNNGNFEGGTFFVSNDAGHFYFKVDQKPGWLIEDLYIFVGDAADIPLSASDNPILAKFPIVLNSPPQEVIDISFESLMIEEDREAVHIAVFVKLTNGDPVDPETKSVFAEPDGDCDDCCFTGPRGGGYFTYYLQSCDPEATTSSLEGASLLADEGELVTLCMGIDPEKLALFTKNNNVENGEQLGEVDISTDGQNLIFSFTAYPEWYISAIHINVGEFEDYQHNGAGMVPVGKFDFNMPFEVPTNVFPVIFPISLLEEDFSEDFISGEASEKFLVQATLVTMEVDAEGNLITSGTTSVFAAEWTEPVSPSGRQRRGSATQTDPGRGGTIYDGFFDLKLVECPPSE